MPTPLADDPRFAMFDDLTDLVVVIDADARIVYANPFSAQVLEHENLDLVGDSIADYLHPDDLIRALEVVTLIVGEKLDVPVTPALYRLRRQDGSWCPIEINGSMLAGPADEGLVLVIGRYSGDRHLQDRIVELLTTGMAIPDIVELVPEFGHWRHPHEHYAVIYTHLGEPRSAGSALAAHLITLDSTDASPWGRAATTGDDVLMPTEDLPATLHMAADAEALLACWAVPVVDPLYPEPAVLIAWSREHGPAPTVHRYSLETMARSLTLILQWRAQVAELEDAARRDPLTGITNRTGFFETLRFTAGDDGRSREVMASAAARVPADRHVAVLYVDLDGFKAVNDVHGHSVGDAVLGTVAERIGRAVRAGDVLARLGGDEFAVLCPTFDADHDLTRVADRIIAVVTEPIDVGDVSVAVGASVGIATAARAQVEANPDALVDLADQALYQAKADGRGRWHFAGTPPPIEDQR